MLRFAPLFFGAAVVLSAGCATTECSSHDECGSGRYCGGGFCRQACRETSDCAAGQVCTEIGRCDPADAGTTVAPDGGPEVDSGMIGMDGGPVDGGMTTLDGGPPPIDGGAPIDAGPTPGTGRYLDRCATDASCASLRCVDDIGGSRMCTRTCTTHDECASRHVCSAGVCRYDDTGVGCNLAAPESCRLGLCVGSAAVGSGHCTRPCDGAAICPSGFACTEIAGQHVCVDIERPCTAAAQCATGLCVGGGLGCTATCRSAADCPPRLPGLPPYACGTAAGVAGSVCLIPADVMGADPIGSACPAVGTVSCRSGGCLADNPTGPMCIQSCNERGGCGPAFGCFPFEEAGAVTLACARAGTEPLGAACATGRVCDSGLCQPPGYCTRLCTRDGLCPTGMTCSPTGIGISLCLR